MRLFCTFQKSEFLMVAYIFERMVGYFQRQYFLRSLRSYSTTFDICFIKTFCSRTVDRCHLIITAFWMIPLFKSELVLAVES